MPNTAKKRLKRHSYYSKCIREQHNKLTYLTGTGDRSSTSRRNFNFSASAFNLACTDISTLSDDDDTGVIRPEFTLQATHVHTATQSVMILTTTTTTTTKHNTKKEKKMTI